MQSCLYLGLTALSLLFAMGSIFYYDNNNQEQEDKPLLGMSTLVPVTACALGVLFVFIYVKGDVVIPVGEKNIQISKKCGSDSSENKLSKNNCTIKKFLTSAS